MKPPLTQQQQLVNYVKKNLEKGYTIDTLKYSLYNQGYGRTSVEKAIDLANKEIALKVPKLKEKPQIVYKVIEDGDNNSINKNKNQSVEIESSLNFFQKFLRKIGLYK